MAPAGSTCLGQTRVQSPTNVQPQIPSCCERMSRRSFAPWSRESMLISLRQGDGRGSTEQRIQSVDRTGSVAQQAIDAHAELLVGVQFLRGLEVLALGQRLLVLPDDPRLRLGELHQKIGGVYDQVAQDGEIPQRLHADRA